MQSRGLEEDSKCQISSFVPTIIHDSPFCVSRPPTGGDKEAAQSVEAGIRSHSRVNHAVCKEDRQTPWHHLHQAMVNQEPSRYK